MNEKHAREARIVNRLVGTLVKKGDLPVNPETGATLLGRERGKHHKLPRAVKRSFDRLTHKQKARRTIYWRSGVAASLKSHGVVPKGEAARPSKPARVASRSQRRLAERQLNAIIFSGLVPGDASYPWR